jgi:hypothetical protein
MCGTSFLPELKLVPGGCVLYGLRYSTSTLGSLAIIFFGVCLYAAEGEVGGSYYGIGLTTMGAALAATKGGGCSTVSASSIQH